jgi:dTDP-D-glucose 4,6-dehydratase
MVHRFVNEKISKLSNINLDALTMLGIWKISPILKMSQIILFIKGDIVDADFIDALFASV